jgi:hypothetical protein
VALISISYTVPVQVIVDTTTSTVRRVVVIDEAISQYRSGHHADHDANTSLAADAAQVTGAYVIAEAEEWPSWDIGW